MNLNFTTRDRDHRAIDLCHAVTIFGMALSAKPKDILELGVDPGRLPMRYPAPSSTTSVGPTRRWTPGSTTVARSQTSGLDSATGC